MASQPSTTFLLRLLELVALLFPVILFLIQTAFKLVGSDRERDVGRLFKWGVGLVVGGLVYLFTLSNEVINQLTGRVPEEITTFASAVFTLLFLGTALLIGDAYFEGLARVEDDQKPNSVQMELPREEEE